MSTLDLPDRPSLDHLRHQAADLQRATGVTRSAAQLEIARRYGFPSWPRLKHHVELVNRYTRVPDEVPPVADPADEFLRLACLTYSAQDGPARWQAARRLLADHPEIPDASIHAAAVVADPARVRRFLARDSGLAKQEGGPYRWEPLFYLAYARHDPAVPEADTLDTARVLLAHGADPNAGYLWHGLRSPFTVLTGVFGEGEQGPVRQPRHPHSLALARLLLDAGADPNDEQALYNRVFGPDNDHLELLFEYGLGTVQRGPWRDRLGRERQSVPDMLRWQLEWAAVHGMTARVRLLVAHHAVAGAAEAALHAARSGYPEIAAELGASVELTGVDALVAAALAGDRDEVERLRSADPGVLAAARAERPGLIVWAARCRRPDAVALLVELGFDVNALGRADIPVEQPWQTALHTAVSDDNPELVRLLLALGADREIPDARFHTTPLGWARYFENNALVRLLTE